MTRALRAAKDLGGRCDDALEWMRRHPDSPRSAIYKKLHMSASTFQRLLHRMRALGLVEVARVERGVQLWRCKQ